MATGLRFLKNYIYSTGQAGIDIWFQDEKNQTALVYTNLAFSGNIFEGFGTAMDTSNVLGTNNSTIASNWTAKNTYI